MAGTNGALNPSKGPRRELDEADRRILSLLSADGRLSNRALAAEIGLTEVTVAARIRSLVGRRLLGVSAVVDWRAAGYDWDIWLEIDVRGRVVAEVGAEVLALEGVHAVHSVFGPTDLVVHAMFRDRESTMRFLTETLATVDGVDAIRTSTTLETMKYAVQFARLPGPSEPLSLPAPVVDLDELDHSIIGRLVADGRASNREIGRVLGVSEGTIRARLRRMGDAGLLRIVGQHDPLLAGEVYSWAFVMIDVRSGAMSRVAAKMAALPESAVVAVLAGRHDLLVLLACRSRDHLVDVVTRQIRADPDVRITDTWEVVTTLDLDFRWARLVGDVASGS